MGVKNFTQKDHQLLLLSFSFLEQILEGIGRDRECATETI